MQPKNNIPVLSRSGLQLAKATDNSLSLINQLIDEGNPEYWYEKASKAKEQKEWEAAFHFYSKAVQFNNKEEKYLVLKSYCAMKINKSEIAANSLIQAFKFRKAWYTIKACLTSDKWFDLRNYFYLFYTSEYNSSFTNALLETTCNNFETGLSILDSLEDEEKNLNPDFFDLRGIINLLSNDFENAIKDYGIFITLEPGNARAYYNRGNAYKELKEFSLAVNDYTTCIKIDPEYADAYFKRGYVYDELKEYTLAINDYTTCIGLEPTNADAYFNRGCIYDELKEYTLAINDYTTCIGLEPTNADAYFNRGCIYDELKEYTLAINDYTTCIGLEPTNADAYFNRGCIYKKLKEFSLAINDFTTCIELDPKKNIAYDAYINRSHSYYKLKEISLAINNLTTSIGIYPKYAKAYYIRGLIYFDLKEFSLAIQDFTIAIEFDPQKTEAYSFLQKSKEELKKSQSYNEV